MKPIPLGILILLSPHVPDSLRLSAVDSMNRLALAAGMVPVSVAKPGKKGAENDSDSFTYDPFLRAVLIHGSGPVLGLPD